MNNPLLHPVLERAGFGNLNRRTVRMLLLAVLVAMLVLLDLFVLYDGPGGLSDWVGISSLAQQQQQQHHHPERLAFIGIFTLPSKVSRRALIRSTYLRYAPASMRVVFVFGQPQTHAERTLIAFENATYGDLLVLPCSENMNEGKTWYFLRAVADRFGGPSSSSTKDQQEAYAFTFKADDDAFLHLPNLERRLRALPSRSTYFGRIWDRRDIMAGMLYGFSWDLVQHIAYDPSIVASSKAGDEDQVAGAWVKGRVEHMISEDGEFYDEPLSQAGWAHAYTPGSIVIHQLKRPDWFLRAVHHFFGSQLGREHREAAALLDAVEDAPSREENWSMS